MEKYNNLFEEMHKRLLNREGLLEVISNYSHHFPKGMKRISIIHMFEQYLNKR